MTCNLYCVLLFSFHIFISSPVIFCSLLFNWVVMHSEHGFWKPRYISFQPFTPMQPCVDRQPSIFTRLSENTKRMIYLLSDFLLHYILPQNHFQLLLLKGPAGGAEARPFITYHNSSENRN